MPLYGTDAAALVAPAVRGEFQAAYNKRILGAVIGDIATMMSGTLPRLPLAWLGTIPVMRKWVGGRELKTLPPHDFAILDAEWEDTIGFERTLVEDDQLGACMMRVRDLAAEAAICSYRAATQLVFAANPNSYDGVPLFSASHPVASATAGVYSNTGTDALDATKLKAAITQLQSVTDDNGEPLGITPTHLMVGPALRWTAKELLNSTITVVTGQITATTSATLQGNSNSLQGELQLIVNPYLIGAYANYWYVLDNTREMRACIHYERSDVPVEVTVKAQPDDENVFWRGQIVAGARKRFNVAAGMWQTAFGGLKSA